MERIKTILNPEGGRVKVTLNKTHTKYFAMLDKVIADLTDDQYKTFYNWYYLCDKESGFLDNSREVFLMSFIDFNKFTKQELVYLLQKSIESTACDFSSRLLKEMSVNEFSKVRKEVTKKLNKEFSYLGA